MKPEIAGYELTPKIVHADRIATLTLAPRFDHLRFEDHRRYEATYYPTEEISERSHWPAENKPKVRVADGALQITQYLEAEQEHVFLVEEIDGDQRRPLGSFRVYSLRDDLFARRPFKGDLHIHSSRSDGRESPAYVAAACRQIGLDFMALTDHRRYAPSLEAIRAFDGVDIDLALFPGEEVHPPDNPVHMVNFGGAFSVNDLFTNEADYRIQVNQILESLPQLPPGVNRYQYASCQWCFDKIRQAGGLGIFCHPYWFTENRYAPSGALTSCLFERQPFDAYEVIGGYFRWRTDSNTLQVARYHEERAQGRHLPIVGVSDAHGCQRDELFGWYYTIVFSPSLALPDLVSSVKSLYSVAVEAVPGETPRPYGPFRLVKYALFLLREVFPRHDEWCLEEGRLMLEHIYGNPAAAEMLHALKGRGAARMDRFWQTD